MAEILVEGYIKQKSHHLGLWKRYEPVTISTLYGKLLLVLLGLLPLGYKLGYI
jgi:hypothetical protein